MSVSVCGCACGCVCACARVENRERRNPHGVSLRATSAHQVSPALESSGAMTAVLWCDPKSGLKNERLACLGLLNTISAICSVSS